MRGRMGRIFLLVALLGLSVAGGGEVTPRRMSVMWRLRMPGYQISDPSVSPDGRLVAFSRQFAEMLTFGQATVLSPSQKSAIQRDTWRLTPQVVVMTRGSTTPKPIGYGRSPFFVDGGRALRFTSFLKPKDDGGVIHHATVDLRTGTRTDDPNKEANWIRIPSQSSGKSKVYWRQFDGGSANQLPHTVYVSDTAAGSRRAFAAFPKEKDALAIFETPGGTVAKVECWFRATDGHRESLTEYWQILPRRRLLWAAQRPVGNQESHCFSRLLRDGRLLVCEVLATPRRKAGPSGVTTTTRWWRIDAATGLAERLSWKPSAVPSHLFGVSLSPDGTLAAVVDNDPLRTRQGVSFRVMGPNRVLTNITEPDASSRVTVYRVGQKEPLGYWTADGMIGQSAWTPDGRGLLLSVAPFGSNRMGLEELVYLKVPSGRR